MISIRMRASKTKNRREHHISGAEGIYEKSAISKIVKAYTERALNHPRGKPDKIVISIEDVKQKPKKAGILPVKNLKCSSSDEARNIISQALANVGVSKRAVKNAFRILTSTKTMRGASLILQESGTRMEPDKERGVRVSRLGIKKPDEKKLSKMLSRIKINTDTVKEALLLASKTASYPDIIAEICISDDPDYTTGYISSKEFGYLRIPNIKNRGEMHGGRVFFVKEGVNIKMMIDYLEKIPVIMA